MEMQKVVIGRCKLVVHVTTWQKSRNFHTSYLSRTPRICSCKFFLAGVNFYRFNAKNWQFTVYFVVIYTFFFGVNFILQKFCSCKKMTNMRYAFCLYILSIMSLLLFQMSNAADELSNGPANLSPCLWIM